MKNISLPLWTIATPLVAWLAFGGSFLYSGTLVQLVLAACLVGAVLSAVHHAEVVAHWVGEPFGTLLLALAITVIEVALIVSIMLSGGPETGALARDTVFAAIMIILSGIVGICLLVGGIKYKEQTFSLQGVNAGLIALTAIVVLTLLLPNYTTSQAGPYYTPLQLGFVAIVSLVLYGTFVLVQTVRHRDYFLPADLQEDVDAHAEVPNRATAMISLLFLLLSLAIVVILAKSLSGDIERAVVAAGAPKSLVGIIIAAVVLLPEGLAAYRAASRNRLQTSLNLALGSALASIGLTIPAVAILSIFGGMHITLGIDMKSTLLVLLALFTSMLSLANGRTNVLQGVVLLLIFAVYLFTTIAP
ncbi:calcium:proton antiporter [Pedobacter sp. SYP-B3415]|uniref:calcium:proton antiporter n=1 Tax=Pedobacter sp. SYP-B3415 TaxID=2496641 RepID=UPI00101CC1DA|nr:ionic transporter y4hA [Pedobacter sp. SYP-B3415]